MKNIGFVCLVFNVLPLNVSQYYYNYRELQREKRKV